MNRSKVNRIIPQPQTIIETDGKFTLKSAAKIAAHGPGAIGAANLLADYLRPATGYPLPVTEDADPEAGNICVTVTGEGETDAPPFADESYTLTVTETGVSISAPHAAGAARAVQTLRQLFSPKIFAAEPRPNFKWKLPACRIEDAPRFNWRGMHLDVGRHFFTVEQVCRFIDLLALHRFNIFHLHLTEDQGWRIEIKKYPKLTEIGSVREATIVGHDSDRPRQYDDTLHGGYYTQDDIRAIVAFAARRHITVVPEIDMPGHMQAAIAAYPELGCTDQTIKPRCHWGISRNILNANESTVAFMQDVFTEVMALFPGPFIHIGGDEAHKHEWNESRAIQDRMREVGAANEDELQSWFIRQMGEHIAANGRRMIGWDEILDGGLAEGATVMSWRGEKGGIEAAGQDHDVVMSSYGHTYFDYYQHEPISAEPLAIGGLITTGQVYSYEPIPAELSPDKHGYVLGAQGQLWTEYIPNPDRLDYMAFPRACALAEVLWLDPADKNYADFLRRLKTHRKRLNRLGVNAHPQP